MHFTCDFESAEIFRTKTRSDRFQNKIATEYLLLCILVLIIAISMSVTLVVVEFVHTSFVRTGRLSYDCFGLVQPSFEA